MTCLRVPKDAQPLESRLRLQLGLLEIDLKLHDRESLESSGHVLAENEGRNARGQYRLDGLGY